MIRARSSTYIRGGGGGGGAAESLFWLLFFPFSGPSISDQKIFQLGTGAEIGEISANLRAADFLRMIVLVCSMYYLELHLGHPKRPSGSDIGLGSPFNAAV